MWNNYSDTPDWIHSDAYDLDSNLIEATPLQLVDPNSKNFMPNSSSFLFDQARTIDGFNKPFVGPAPDIGAYEAGGTPWTAGVDAIVDVCGDCESDPNSPPIFDPVDPVDPVEPGEPVQPAIELIDRERFTTDSNVTVGAINLDIVAAEVKGDWDQDLDVDNADIRALMSAVLARQTIDMSFDINEDGLVNMLDVRALAASCTRTNCATN